MQVTTSNNDVVRYAQVQEHTGLHLEKFIVQRHQKACELDAWLANIDKQLAKLPEMPEYPALFAEV